MKKLLIIVMSIVFISSMFLPSASAGYWNFSETRIHIKENRAQAQANAQDFQETYEGEVASIALSLTEDQKNELREVQSDFYAEMKQFEGLITTQTSLYEREEIYYEIKEVLASYFGKIEYIVRDNVAASEFLDDRYELFQANEELREDTRKTWYDYVDSLINDLTK